MKFAILVAASLWFASMPQAQSQELSPQAFFHRCYAQLTGKPVPLGNALMALVASGKVSALEACKQTLRKGQLAGNGELALKNDPEAKDVLNTLYDFHRTWFASNNFDTVPGYNSSTHNGNIDIYDATEPALALTYAVFGLNQPYSSVLQRSSGVTAIRTESAAMKTRLGWLVSNPGRMLSNTADMAASNFTFRANATTSTVVSTNINTHISTKLKMPVLTVGDLVGIKPTSQSFTVPNISLQTGNNNTDKGTLYPDLNYSYDFFKTYGGGVLGTPIYLLQYYGHGFNMKFNGQNKLARRWSQENMQAFLCASLPALRESDVRSMVDIKSTAAFRNSASCVMCHATLDPMAYTARNITVGAFDVLRPTQNGVVTTLPDGTRVNPPAAFLRNATAITSYKASKTSVTGWPSAVVADFHLQQPTGRLYFRSFTGALIDKSVNGIAGLGAAMSNTDDYYLCAAKRYFEFMTGINVPLYDRTDPANEGLNLALTSEAMADRSFVEGLAQGLRSSGSVLKMIEEIMGSNYYKNENFR